MVGVLMSTSSGSSGTAAGRSATTSILLFLNGDGYPDPASRSSWGLTAPR